jgi:glycosyltransferase involved in cell wall biosynthesis
VSEPADVCLILEGTYPYVRGGVSSWVHSIVSGLPEIRFALLVISAERKAAQARQYVLPPNVVRFTEVFLHELIDDDEGRRATARARSTAWETMCRYHRAPSGSDQRREHAAPLLRAMGDPDARALSVHQALHSPQAWDFVLERYQALAAGTSFIDYFWTWRAVHAPLFQAMIAEIPEARLYHPISTGYAGLLGVLGKLRSGRPLLLTEHGIYVRERSIDIGKADWIYEEPVRIRIARPGSNPLKEMWTHFFEELGRLTYDFADQIVTLFRGNERLQHELGADRAKTTVVPNGVKLDVYGPLRRARTEPGAGRPLRVGFIGRVVPIKDLKHLIKACAIVAEELPSTEFWVVGPTDEDPTYFEECQQLAASLGLSNLRFTGSKDVRTIYPEIDVMVLTSVSEGQPLSILEAAAAGVPTVATDVGACSELVDGMDAEDRAIGPGGLITPMGDAGATAAALIRVLSDAALRRRMSEAGARRADRYYGEAAMLDRYREIYRRHIAARGGRD